MSQFAAVDAINCKFKQDKFNKILYRTYRIEAKSFQLFGRTCDENRRNRLTSCSSFAPFESFIPFTLILFFHIVGKRIAVLLHVNRCQMGQSFTFNLCINESFLFALVKRNLNSIRTKRRNSN